MQLRFQRIQNHLNSIERMSRLLRSEFESCMTVFVPEGVQKSTQVTTSVNKFLESGTEISSLVVQPYDPFFPGLWVGLDQEIGGSHVVISARRRVYRSPTGNEPLVSRLSVHPIFPLAEKPRWVTLETVVDLNSLRGAASLDVHLVSFLDIGIRKTVEIPNRFNINFRIESKGGDADVFRHSVPVTTLPFESSIHIAGSGVKTLTADGVTNVTCIIELPLSGDYVFNLDSFQIIANEA